MITAAQEDYIERYAYLPEHILPYVVPISQAEPHLVGNYLVYGKKGHLIVIGYPFEETRLLLLDFMDNLLDLLDTDPEFHSFTMD